MHTFVASCFSKSLQELESETTTSVDLLFSRPRVGWWDLISEGKVREIDRKSPTYELNPSRANERVGPFVQDLNSLPMGTTYLLTLKRLGVNSILHPMSLAIHLVLPMKWEAYWASVDELPSPMRI
ncbi:hypothetical protein E5676_scaffold1312G00110 [Cucumis melo var. makuwa]|uniref:Uncharacterized protein n=1 Tax=Cucumis melo var. makuwa TaxID=1194695 RepID=A0A5D3DCF9_CUCMM|nr:hypothetical protein E6C27_scaffold29G00180 [Cucumis melo var. makuwa]TYK21188.1 hypothetical protein E5676_scaffold1312G00110 [Cucumis melo var. makuwa]